MPKGHRRLSGGLCPALLLLALLTALLLPSDGFGAVLYKDYEVRRVDGLDILCDAYVVQKGDHVMQLFRLRGQISEKAFPEFLRIFLKLNPRIKNIDRIYPGQFILIPLKKVSPHSLPEQETGSVSLPLVTTSDQDGESMDQEVEIKGQDVEIVGREVEIKVQGEPFEEHVVRYGDTVSGLLASRFGGLQTPGYRQAFLRFKNLNPQVRDLNRIFAGDSLMLPVALGKPVKKAPKETKVLARETQYPPLPSVQAAKPKDEISVHTLAQAAPEERLQALLPLSGVVSSMGGMLMDKGVYFFPRPGKEDIKLDLSKHPVMRLPNGQFVLLGSDTGLSKKEKQAIDGLWGPVEIFELSQDASADMLLGRILAKAGIGAEKKEISFADGNVEVSVRCHLMLPGQGLFQYVAVTWIDSFKQKTAEPICQYLSQNSVRVADVVKGGKSRDRAEDEDGNGDDAEDKAFYMVVKSGSPRFFVSALLRVLNIDYTENTPISFPYAGFEVNTLVNKVKTASGNEYIINFGTLRGQSRQILENMGLGVIRVKKKDDFLSIARQLAEEMSLDIKRDPVFFAADRPQQSCASLNIPGFLVFGGGLRSVLVTNEPLHDKIIEFLIQKETGVLVVKKHLRKPHDAWAQIANGD